MSRNGAIALIFHTLFIAFVLAPIVIVCARPCQSRTLRSLAQV